MPQPNRFDPSQLARDVVQVAVRSCFCRTSNQPNGSAVKTEPMNARCASMQKP